MIHKLFYVIKKYLEGIPYLLFYKAAIEESQYI